MIRRLIMGHDSSAFRHGTKTPNCFLGAVARAAYSVSSLVCVNECWVQICSDWNRMEHFVPRSIPVDRIVSHNKVLVLIMRQSGCFLCEVSMFFICPHGLNLGVQDSSHSLKTCHQANLRY